MSNIAERSAGAAWRTALDVDFTAQPTQMIASDGDYTIAGHTFTKINSAHELAPMTLTSGVGLTVTPDQVSAYSGAPWTRTSPGLAVSLPSLIPDFDIMTRLRVWVYIASDNIAAANDNAFVAIENSTAETSFLLTKFFYSGAMRAYSRRIWAGALPGDNNQTWTAGDNTIALHLVCSLGLTTFTGVKTAVWNDPSQLVTRAACTMAGTALAAATALGLGSAWSVLITAARGGSGTALVVTFGALKIEWQV